MRVESQLWMEDEESCYLNMVVGQTLVAKVDGNRRGPKSRKETLCMRLFLGLGRAREQALAKAFAKKA